MSHTPGPWRAHRPGEWDDPSAYWEIDDPYGHTATVYGDDAEAEANARLIAAAPDLLEALRVAHDALDYAQAQVDSENDAHRLRQWRVQVGRVLAKAEGRE